ncbi:MAG: hypothetical protein WAL15_21790, partial [Xanthobacteraceae bacterium]
GVWRDALARFTIGVAVCSDSGVLTAPCGGADNSSDVDRFIEIGLHTWSTIHLTIRGRLARVEVRIGVGRRPSLDRGTEGPDCRGVVSRWSGCFGGGATVRDQSSAFVRLAQNSTSGIAYAPE